SPPPFPRGRQPAAGTNGTNVEGHCSLLPSAELAHSHTDLHRPALAEAVARPAASAWGCRQGRSGRRRRAFREQAPRHRGRLAGWRPAWDYLPGHSGRRAAGWTVEPAAKARPASWRRAKTSARSAAAAWEVA